MKLSFFYLISFCCLITSFISIKTNDASTSSDSCQAIRDSANIFVQTGEFAVNTKPTIEDPQRHLILDKWLQSLSFKDLRCLLESANVSLKTLGFIYGAISHSDSLYKTYSHLLSDTTTVQLFMTDGTISPKIKLGELLSSMSQGIKKDKSNFAKRPEIENIVSAFIKQYATYPNSYKPISFPLFRMGSDNQGGPYFFSIRHEYEIKNNEGKTERVISAFVLDEDLRINVIEKDSSSYSDAFPPKLGSWLNHFGRKLNKKDSLTLNLR